MNNQTLEEKIERLPLDVIDLFYDLFSDEIFFKQSILFGIEDFVIENKAKFIEKLIDIEVEKKDRTYFLEYLHSIIKNDLIIQKINENLEISVWSEIDEIYKNDTSLASTLKTDSNLEEAKLKEKTDSNHISHIDVLSEIENPTPSISTPPTPQREATTESQTTLNSLKPLSKDSSTQLSSPNPSLHSSPSIAPYVNPALHIASKLDQNLSNPSASVPKEMYVSKKPDPYHEPLDL